MKIDKGFFDYQMQRLISVYGSKAYPSERVGLIFEKVKDLDRENLSKAFDRLIANNKYAPMLNEIQDELYPQLEALRVKAHEKLKTDRICHSCKNTGRISVQLNPNEANYSFQCDCKLGEQMFPNFPKYKPRR